jgi:hypothetical protein
LVEKYDCVRLTRELPEHQLAAGREGTVEQVVRSDDGRILGVVVRFYIQSGTITPVLPLEVLEPVLANARDRTAVFWELRKPPGQMIESAMRVMFDHGFTMDDGLNVVRLHYISRDKWWRWGEPMRDATGAEILAASSLWDGIAVAFSGWEGFQLEFRSAGQRPALFLHERDGAFLKQSRETHYAMEFLRLLLELCAASGAEYCAFPVDLAWLAEGNWPSLLTEPLYPDFLLLPPERQLNSSDNSFRHVQLTDGRTIVTTLPVKSSPHETPVRRSERELQLSQLRKLIALGEKYYDQMYDARTGLSGLYANMKDAFRDAVALSSELGLAEESKRLGERLEHIKAVFRSQFS